MRHQRYLKAGIGAWQTLLCIPIVYIERLPKEAAGGQRARCGLETSKRRKHSAKKERKYYENLSGQAGQTTSEMRNSLTGPD